MKKLVKKNQVMLSLVRLYDNEGCTSNVFC